LSYCLASCNSQLCVPDDVTTAVAKHEISSTKQDTARSTDSQVPSVVSEELVKPAHDEVQHDVDGSTEHQSHSSVAEDVADSGRSGQSAASVTEEVSDSTGY